MQVLNIFVHFSFANFSKSFDKYGLSQKYNVRRTKQIIQICCKVATNTFLLQQSFQPLFAASAVSYLPPNVFIEHSAAYNLDYAAFISRICGVLIALTSVALDYRGACPFADIPFMCEDVMFSFIKTSLWTKNVSITIHAPNFLDQLI